MERIESLHDAEARVFQEVERLLLDGRKVFSGEPRNLEEGIGALASIRSLIYENLNQIQHEAMILRAARSLERDMFAGREVQWYWNPRQTGGAEEPDLRGEAAGRIAVSAEVTASETPRGTIDSRMRRTLEKLSSMPGKKFYFVRTDAMVTRARTKVARGALRIEVRLV